MIFRVKVFIKKFYKAIYPSDAFFFALMLVVVIAVAGYFYDTFLLIAKLLLYMLLSLAIGDMIFLFSLKLPVSVKRVVPIRMSNGDENEINIFLKNNTRWPLHLQIIDEIPHQFQQRNFSIRLSLKGRQERQINYYLKPVRRGEYEFGHTILFMQGIFHLIARRIEMEQPVNVPVYPSFIQMRKYELLTVNDQLYETGIKKIRRLGHHAEFDHIREYIKGDDYRTVNWKATARKGKIMVNQFQDERAQEVYSIIDLGRVMQMPFGGMTLLDYSINAALVISKIAILKYDKAGLITFSKKIDDFLPAEKNVRQMQKIFEALYNTDTVFQEPDYELLYITIKRKITQRSLLILYTNFETQVSMLRYIDIFRRLAKNHLILLVFFENTEVNKLLRTDSVTLNDVYKTITAEKFIYDKKLIVKELNRHGVHALLTPPESLSINLINKYLEFKLQGKL